MIFMELSPVMIELIFKVIYPIGAMIVEGSIVYREAML
jgi:hypothetical protein